MQAPEAVDQFVRLVSHASRIAGEGPLDADLQRRLNEQLPATGEIFQSIFESCREAIAAGWMCQRSAGGIRYGRVIKPAQQLGRFSVDVVDMRDIAGPRTPIRKARST